MTKEDIIREYHIRRFIFLFLQAIAVICMFNNALEGVVYCTLFIVIYIGILLFKLIEQLNNERG